MRTLEIELGWLYLAPGPRECYHRVRECPHINPDYSRLEPGDGGYSHIINTLEECEWCVKFRYGLVDPLPRPD